MEQYAPVTVYSDNPQVPKLPASAALEPTERAPAAMLLQNYRGEPIGNWTGNRYKQAEHYRGIPFIAIRAVCNLAGGATYQAYKKNKKQKPKTTFGPGGSVTKSVPTPQASGRDEDYLPFDDEEHPLCKILNRPNPHETFGELSAKMVLQNRLTGVGPMWAVPNFKHQPVELWSLKTPLLFPNWQRTKQYPNGSWRVMNYGQQGWAGSFSGGSSGGSATLPGEEVKRWMEPHPFIDWDGFSPLDGGAVQLDVLESIDEARKTSMDEGVVLGTYIMAPGASQTELDAVVAEMKQKHAGSKRHRAFAAFAFGGPDSKGTIQSDTQRPVDMEYSQGWDQMTAFCLALFGVPKIVAGLENSETYASGFAARQQFHDEQANYLESLATFYTKNLAWPWCSFDGEYLVRAKPRPINDHELAEKKHARQCQYDTITFDESRAKDDEPAWEDPAIGKLPLSIALKMIEQSVMPQPIPQPGMDPNDPNVAMDPNAMGADPNAMPPGEEEQPQDAAGLMDSVTAEALNVLGVPAEDEQADEQQAGQPVMKAASKSGIFKDARGHRYKLENGKRVPIGDTGGGGASQSHPGRTQGGKPRGSTGSSTAGDRRGYRSQPAGKPTNLLDPMGRVHAIRGPDDLRKFQAAGGKVPPGMAMPGQAPPPLPGRQQPPPLPQQAGRPTPPPLPPQQTYATPPATRQEHQQRVKQSAPRVAQMAGNIPEGADVLASASKWAAAAADKHAEKVAAHLGVSREEAHALIKSTIEHLCHVASGINKTGASQKTVRGASGKTLRFKIGGAGPKTQSGKMKQNNREPSGPPRPANPQARGSLAPRPGVVKAIEGMNGLEGSAGAFLVPPGNGKRKKRKRRKGKVSPESIFKGL